MDWVTAGFLLLVPPSGLLLCSDYMGTGGGLHPDRADGGCHYRILQCLIVWVKLYILKWAGIKTAADLEEKDRLQLLGHHYRILQC